MCGWWRRANACRSGLPVTTAVMRVGPVRAGADELVDAEVADPADAAGTAGERKGERHRRENELAHWRPPQPIIWRMNGASGAPGFI